MPSQQTKLTQQDLKIFPSERMTDNPDGGGLPVNTTLTGADNEVFDPISRIDNTKGDLSIRSVYTGINKDDDTRLYGSFFAITEPPENDAVAYLSMKAENFAESREEIAERIESSRVLKNLPYRDAKKHNAKDKELEIWNIGEGSGIKNGDVLYIQCEYTAIEHLSNLRKKFKYGEFVKVLDVQLIDEERLFELPETGDMISSKTEIIKLLEPLKDSYTYDSLLLKGYTTVEESSFICKIFNTEIIEQNRFYGIKPVSSSTQKNSKQVAVTSVTEKIAPVINNEVIKTSGIDVIKLPQNAEVQILQESDEILIFNHQSDDLGTAHTGGQTVQLSRTNVNRICLQDADKRPVNAESWDYDLLAGTITWTELLDLSAYKMPITAHHSQEEINRILKVNDDNTLELQFGCVHDYPAENTHVSSVIETGTLQCWHSIPFTQRNWNGTWSDVPVGNQLLNKLNLTDYPMLLTGDGTITERYLIKWLDDTNFEFYGERLGYLGRFDSLTDFKPINPSTGKALLTIKKEAFGNNLGGNLRWASHDVIRINTRGTLVQLWLLRVVHPNRNEQTEQDVINMCLFGDTTFNKQ